MNRSGLRSLKWFPMVLACALGTAHCGGPTEATNRCATMTCTTDAQHQDAATRAVKQYIEIQLAALEQAARDMQAAAPAPDADGWNNTRDVAAVTALRGAWGRARDAYERIEGAIAVLFPEYDESTDQRYDGFLAALQMRGMTDTNLFDGQGVTGMHAIERILYADSHPAHVVQFESTLMGYQAASYPRNAQEATDFRDGLCKRLIDDVVAMRTMFRPAALDSAAAFRGVIDSMMEQVEKVEAAAAGEEESRYANRTLADMRANLEGGKQTFVLFRPWLKFKNQDALADQIQAQFDAIAARYTSIGTDGIPPVPTGYNRTMPTTEHQATAYHQLRVFLLGQADEMMAGSLVNLMNAGADAMNIPRLPN